MRLKSTIHQALSVLMTLALVVGLMPGMTLTAKASDPEVWNGNTHTVSDEGETINGKVTVSNDATLTIPEDVTITIANTGDWDGVTAITIDSGKTLTIKGAGTLIAQGENGIDDEAGRSAVVMRDGSSLIVDGPTVEFIGGNSGNEASGGQGVDGSNSTITVKSGSLTVRSGASQAGSGRDGISGANVTVTGSGTLTAIGGSGLEGNGKAIDGTITGLVSESESSEELEYSEPKLKTSSTAQYVRVTALIAQIVHIKARDPENPNIPDPTPYDTLAKAFSNFYADYDKEIQLLADVEITETIAVTKGGSTTLDLNGHGILYTGEGEDSRVFSVSPSYSDDVNFTIDDSQQKDPILHKITLDESGRAISSEVVTKPGAESDTVKYITSGYIAGGTDGGIIVNVNENVSYQATLTLENGTIIGNISGGGGGVCVVATNPYDERKSGQFTMRGGVICYNTADYGGGVSVQNKGDGNGVFQMEGGLIFGNKATSTTAGFGGGVYAMGQFTMSGGRIVDNYAAILGGGVIAATTVELSNRAFISGNRAGKVTDNLHLWENNEGEPNTKLTISGALTDGAKIGVTLSDIYRTDPYDYNSSWTSIPATGIFTSGWEEKMGSEATISDFFVSDNSAYAIEAASVEDEPRELRMYVLPVASVTTLEEETTTYYDWGQALSAWADADGSTLTLLMDRQITDTIIVDNDTKTLDLNGYGITYTGTTPGNVITIADNGQLNLTDGGNNADHKHYYTVDEAGLARVNDNLAGEKGVKTFTGGYITGGRSLIGGGIVISGSMSDAGGTLIMSGGTIIGNQASYGAGVYAGTGSTFLMEGGSIIHNLAHNMAGGVSFGGTFSVNNAPVIADNKAGDTTVVNGNVSVPTKKPITVGTLTEGASIGVTLEGNTGVFTTGVTAENADTYKDYFFSDADYNVMVETAEGDTQHQLKLGMTPVTYIGHDAETGVAQSQSTNNYRLLQSDETGETVQLGNTTFVVRGNTTITGHISLKGTVNLILCDEAILDARSSITVVNGVTLNIFAQSTGNKMGTLIAYSTNGNAAIGSTTNYDGGTVNIHGGNISAVSDDRGAGIGTHDALSATGCNVTIYDGRVVAIGGEGKAGIGNSNAPESINQGSLAIKNAKLAVYGSNDSLGQVAAYDDYITTRYRYMRIMEKPLTPITPTVSISGWTYGQAANTPTITGNTGNGTVTYQYKPQSAADDTYTSTVPASAGQYTVRATIAATDTYASGTATANFTISQATVTVRASSHSIYVGDPIPALSGSYTVTGLVGSDQLLTSPTLSYASTPDNSSAGSYTITASGASAGSNYLVNYLPGTLTISVAPHTHTLEHHPAVAATCDTAGNEEYWSCTGCDELFADSDATQTLSSIPVIPALGHAWGDWTVTKTPTKAEPGEETRVCQHDPSHVETRELPFTSSVEAEVETTVEGVTVSNLEEVAEAEAGEVADNTFVKTEMTVTAVESSDPVAVSDELAAAVDTAISGAETSTVETKYLSIDVEKYTTTVQSDGSGGTTQQTAKSTVTDLGQVVEIGASLAGLGIHGPLPRIALIVRQHGHEALVFHALSAKPARDFRDGTSYYDRTSGIVYIYSRYFSTFAVLTSTAETYTVTLDATSGTVEPSSLYATEGSTVTLPTPTHDGTYSFGGWYTAADGGERVANIYPVLSDQTLYARWTYLDEDDGEDDDDDDDSDDKPDNSGNSDDSGDDSDNSSGSGDDSDDSDNSGDDNSDDSDDNPDPDDSDNSDDSDNNSTPDDSDDSDNSGDSDNSDDGSDDMDDNSNDDGADDVNDNPDEDDNNSDDTDNNPGEDDDDSKGVDDNDNIDDNSGDDSGDTPAPDNPDDSADDDNNGDDTDDNPDNGEVDNGPADDDNPAEDPADDNIDDNVDDGPEAPVDDNDDDNNPTDPVDDTDNPTPTPDTPATDNNTGGSSGSRRRSSSSTQSTAASSPTQSNSQSESKPESEPEPNESSEPEQPEQTDLSALQSFRDLDPQSWYANGIGWALTHGVMQGYEDGLFRPNNPTTRTMMAQILYNLAGQPAASLALSYTDVAPRAWYAPAVSWATEQGIIRGYGTDKFGPDDNVTREQLVTILHRYALALGLDVSVGQDTNILSYTDAFEISVWATAAMQWAVGSGIVEGQADAAGQEDMSASNSQGDSETASDDIVNDVVAGRGDSEATTALNLAPKSPATRAEIATIIQRFAERITK